MKKTYGTFGNPIKIDGTYESASECEKLCLSPKYKDNCKGYTYNTQNLEQCWLWKDESNKNMRWKAGDERESAICNQG